MVESYKFKSKLANILVFIAGLVSYIGVEGLQSIIPPQYAKLIPVIVMIAGYIVVQNTENTRVAVAEELVRENYTKNDCEILNDEYVVSDDDNGTQ